MPIIEPYALLFFRAANIWNLFDKFSDLSWGLFVNIIDPPLKNINGGEGSWFKSISSVWLINQFILYWLTKPPRVFNLNSYQSSSNPGK